MNAIAPTRVPKRRVAVEDDARSIEELLGVAPVGTIRTLPRPKTLDEHLGYEPPPLSRSVRKMVKVGPLRGMPDDILARAVHRGEVYIDGDTLVPVIRGGAGGLLAGKHYEPGTVVNTSAAAAAKLTAVDTTNLRAVPTIPSNGIVIARGKLAFGGGTAGLSRMLLGILDSTTIRCRMAGCGGTTGFTQVADTQFGLEMYSVITGLTGATTPNYDLAFGSDGASTGLNLNYGGPDNNSGANAYGAADLEIYDSANILAATLYDPTSLHAQATNALAALTELDTTNLRLTFNAPASGNVQYRIRTVWDGGGATTTPGRIMLGIKEGGAKTFAQSPNIYAGGGGSSRTYLIMEVFGTWLGLSAGSHTWDASYAVQTVAGASGGAIRYGGPDNAIANDAAGGILFELMAA